MYKYKAYGVGIHSDFKLYNFEEVDSEADILIRKINSGINREEYEKQSKWIEYNGNQAFVMTEFAQFFIKEGKYIDVFLEKDVTDLEIAAYICGWGMAFLFMQRGYSAIHSSALEFRDGCVLISGVSGAGKSTTAMELIRRGHKYLSDDISMVNPDDGFIVQPAFPIQKMCRDVAEKDDNQELIYVDEANDKFAKLNFEDFCNLPRPLKGIVMLDKIEADEVKIYEPKGLEKYLKVLSTLFIGILFPQYGIDEGEKFRMLKVAEKIPYIIIKRPVGKETLAEICDIIEEKFGK